MSENVYEGLFLLDSSKTSGDWDTAATTVIGILEKSGAKLVASRPWDERPMAYPINGQKRGMYLLTYFNAPGSSISVIEHECRINEQVLRQLIIKVEPKLVDELVRLAMEGGEEKGEEKTEESGSESKTVAVAADAKADS